MRQEQQHILYELERGLDNALQEREEDTPMEVSLIREEITDCREASLLFCEWCDESEVRGIFESGRAFDMYLVNCDSIACEKCLDTAITDCLPGLEDNA